MGTRLFMETCKEIVFVGGAQALQRRSLPCHFLSCSRLWEALLVSVKIAISFWNLACLDKKTNVILPVA
ncbi:hypothetical protein GOP47_0002535 [Adiantum capillus-veneris]|uniref:Uncharacterized protein n=1 Tax=Adiantum capillus-veneris TaxID=13818 RepID=A0A9D4ZRC3_ADICA|nr:hypothetical protein GOP47_0002535 [Adiantum capillus-veneris]